jgi:hypothetical protein
VRLTQKRVLRTLTALHHHRNRSLIVDIVMWLYAGSVSFTVIYLLYKGFWCGEDKAFSNLFDLLKVAVLPVVTLVIGYYFGTSKSE